MMGVRSREEIVARIKELEKDIERNTVHIHKGFSEVQSPESKQKCDILRAKVNALQWVLTS